MRTLVDVPFPDTYRGVERRVVRQVSPVSVSRVVLGLSLSMTAVGVVGIIALYMLALVSGALTGVETFIRGLGFEFSFLGLLPAFLVLALVSTAAVTVVAVVLTVLYNLLSELFGGVEVVTRQESRAVAR